MENQADVSVQVLCQVLKVSRSAYYAWCKRTPSPREQSNAQLLEYIRVIHADSDATYGMPRVRVELMKQGWTVSRRRIAQLMRIYGLQGMCRRRQVATTETECNPWQSPAPDLVDSQFITYELNRLWVVDATSSPTRAGFMYLTIVLDACSQRVVGWAIGEFLTTKLMLDALNMAFEQRQYKNVTHHGGQGDQYTNLVFGNRCKAMGAEHSMSSMGKAYANGITEAFFVSLGRELFDYRSFKDISEARLAVVTWIEAWYNPKRRHPALNYVSPINFEKEYWQKKLCTT